MSQLTIRATEALVARVHAAARARGSSTNEYVLRVLDAATNPDLAGTEAERVRERLAAAGLLATVPGPTRTRPRRTEVANARAAAKSGTPLTDLVRSGRG